MASVMESTSSAPQQRRTYGSVDRYTKLWDERTNAPKTGDGTVTERKEKYTELVNTYYDLATDFYEWGWGTSFHFAPRRYGESVASSIARHEHFLASRLGLKPGMKALDVGCGVGGPMMEIARFSRANVVGINNNAYQITRGEKHVKAAGLSSLCSFVKGDFMHMPFADETFDAIYAIEAICHAPDKTAMYAELFRVLKPGGRFACYEWCLTKSFDFKDPVHLKIKADIEVGDGLPDIDTTDQVLDSIRKSGFEIEEHEDLAPVDEINQIPWYEPFTPNYLSLNGIRVTNLGVFVTHTTLDVLERVGLLTKGTTQTHSVLMRAKEGLVNGGRLENFTPMFYFLVRKPDIKE